MQEDDGHGLSRIFKNSLMPLLLSGNRSQTQHELAAMGRPWWMISAAAGDPVLPLVMRLLAAAVVLSAAVFQQSSALPFSSIVIPNLRARPFRHTAHDIGRYLCQLRAVDYNHDWPGITEMRDSPSQAAEAGLAVRSQRQVIGTGRALYGTLVQALASGELVNNLGWAAFITEFKPSDLSIPAEARPVTRPEPGQVCLTHVLSYKLLWALNPCRIRFAHWDRSLKACPALPFQESERDQTHKLAARGIYSSVGWSTLRGHLIAGEERFSVEWHREGTCRLLCATCCQL